MSTPIPSFEEVDKIVNSADISALKAAAKRPARSSSKSVAPAAMAMPDICGIYKVVRPILLLVSGTPFIPKKWKDVIKTFIQTLDMICPQ
jgi:hypothetical protein